jgi:hypothetical protein
MRKESILKVFTCEGSSLLALLANILHKWKGLPGSLTILFSAFWSKEKIMAVNFGISAITLHSELLMKRPLGICPRQSFLDLYNICCKARAILKALTCKGLQI